MGALRFFVALALLVPAVARAQVPSLGALDFALTAAAQPGLDVELAVFDPPPTNRVLLATRVPASPDRVRAVLLDPAAWRRSLPELIRAEVLSETLSPPRNEPDRIIAWEVEIPLWNLKGELRLVPQGPTISLEVTQGHMAPARFLFTVHAGSGGTLLVVSATANVRGLNFVTRKVAQRMPMSEPAMTTAVAWAMLRAFALESSRAGVREDGRRWPASKPTPPMALTTAPLAAAATTLAPAGIVGGVWSKPDGRLHHVSVGVRATADGPSVRRKLSELRRWHALPGWKDIEAQEAPSGRLRWEVDTSFPFVDFDALWDITPGPPFVARAIDDDVEGALMTWAAHPLESPGGCLIVQSEYPRVEKAGYFPRKFIEAEPLLEQGLALAHAYLNTVTLAGALVGP